MQAAKEKREALKALKAARAGAAARRAAARKEADDESSTDDVPAAEGGESDSEEEEDPFPGATFTLIKGSKGQRFKRMVLQETCLADHMCGGYCIAIQRLVDKHGAGAAPAPAE